MSTRPTTDRVKESLFNIISGIIGEADILDLYSGTGNLGIEALSRGANSAVFVDKSSECTEIIRDNLVFTKLIDKAEIFNRDVFSILHSFGSNNKKFDIVFLDPPYHKNLVEETLKSIGENDIIKSDSIVIAEHDFEDKVPEVMGVLKRYRNSKYGDTIVSFYKVCE